MSRWPAPGVLLVALLVGGCFSADDFSTCVEAGQCGLDADGRARMCVAGACTTPPAVDPASAFDLPAAAGALYSRPDEVVVIDGVDVSESNLRVEADVIIVRGPIRGVGAGLEGGVAGMGGEAGADGRAGGRGQPAREEVVGGGHGGDGGLAGAGSGMPGEGGQYAHSEPCRIDFDFAQPGSGGGGGGGGGGGTCRGLNGGVGGAGGAAIMLKARRYIEIDGEIIAGGAPGGDAEQMPCDGGESGAGSPGGGGSGGLIYLHAPTILFSDDAALDVRGAGGAGGGLVTIFGDVEGRFPEVLGASGDRICRR